MNSVMMFLSLMTSFRFPTFLFRFLTLMPTVLLVMIYFHLLIVAFAHVAISVFLLAKKRWLFSFHRFWDVFCDHIRDAAQEDIFNLGLSTAAYNFVNGLCWSWCIYTSWNVSSQASLVYGFQQMLLSLLIEITSFTCTSRVDLPKFTCFLKVLESIKLVYANKARESSISNVDLGSWNF